MAQSVSVVALRRTTDLLESLDSLAAALDEVGPGPPDSGLADRRDHLLRTIRSYLIPRFEKPTSPLLVVFAGPTGSGKSTLINSVAGLDVSATGSLRPTTKGPIALVGEDQAESHEIVADLGCATVVGRAPVLASMTMIDTPDIDSTSVGHRRTAEALIDRADVVVFVTSALRYGDLVPWQVLRRAVSRGAPVIHVLNRVTSATRGSIVDYRGRLAAEGLDSDLVTIPEHHLASGEIRVPSLAVRSLTRRLARIATESSTFAGEVLQKVLDTTARQVGALISDMTEYAGRADDLEAELSLTLAKRVASLEIPDMGSVLPGPPPGSGRVSQRRWRRRAAVDVDALSVIQTTVTDRIGAVVRSDLGRWASSDSRVAPGMFTAEAAVEALEATLPGWFEFVARVARAESPRRDRSAEAVLGLAAAGQADPGLAEFALSEGHEELVDRARRELAGRLETVYLGVASQAAFEARASWGELDGQQLATALGAVTRLFTPLHA